MELSRHYFEKYGQVLSSSIKTRKPIVDFVLDLQSNLTGILTHDEHVNKLDPRLVRFMINIFETRLF